MARLLTNLRFWVMTALIAWVSTVFYLIHNQP
ncbi:hypothetical protein SAMN05444320_108144 [Streptoalloteichus hindustanus]|uniref:Uncharacterized protein n=1 Tax=Streptoalloteichus hindustanus TaxID=2017 RepID=A0A1M5J6I3_STRHI|nr:hypothetical protein SAMN05444320_108144 [Streptoalloteichus hindustanus]